MNYAHAALSRAVANAIHGHDGAGPRESEERERAVLHDGAGAESFPRGQWRERIARRRSAGTCGSRFIPDKPVDQVPIGHITNGIHLLGWMKGTVRRFWRQKLTERHR